MRDKERFPYWNWGVRKAAEWHRQAQTPHTQVFLWKHLIFRELLPNLG